jgi:3,4-dihydroxy-2-butanone 4-phosphate synthase
MLRIPLRPDALKPGLVGGPADEAGADPVTAGRSALIALCQVARVPTVAAICEVMGPGGHTLAGAEVERFAPNWRIPLITIEELTAHC